MLILVYSVTIVGALPVDYGKLYYLINDQTTGIYNYVEGRLSSITNLISTNNIILLGNVVSGDLAGTNFVLTTSNNIIAIVVAKDTTATNDAVKDAAYRDGSVASTLSNHVAGVAIGLTNQINGATNCISVITTNAAVEDAKARDIALTNGIVFGSGISAATVTGIVVGVVGTSSTNSAVEDAKSRDAAVSLGLTNLINSSTNCVSVITTNASIEDAKARDILLTNSIVVYFDEKFTTYSFFTNSLKPPYVMLYLTNVESPSVSYIPATYALSSESYGNILTNWDTIVNSYQFTLLNNSSIVCNAAGVLSFSYALSMQSGATGRDTEFAITKNGVVIQGSRMLARCQPTYVQHISSTFKTMVSSNDVFRMVASPAGGSMTLKVYFNNITADVLPISN